jgi:hypothetical protein
MFINNKAYFFKISYLILCEVGSLLHMPNF